MTGGALVVGQNQDLLQRPVAAGVSKLPMFRTSKCAFSEIWRQGTKIFQGSIFDLEMIKGICL